MAAKPRFAAAPKPSALTPEAERFIAQGRGKDVGPSDEPTHRLSVDVPKRLAARYKSACALAGIRMAPDLVSFIKERTAELEAENLKASKG